MTIYNNKVAYTWQLKFFILIFHVGHWWLENISTTKQILFRNERSWIHTEKCCVMAGIMTAVIIIVLYYTWCFSSLSTWKLSQRGEKERYVLDTRQELYDLVNWKLGANTSWFQWQFQLTIAPYLSFSNLGRCMKKQLWLVMRASLKYLWLFFPKNVSSHFLSKGS
jgi:hypothetical protein